MVLEFASVAQSSEQAPVTSEITGSILSIVAHSGMLKLKVVGLLQVLGFPPAWKGYRWVRVNTVEKITTIIVKIK